jgi:hypothetical protein
VPVSLSHDYPHGRTDAEILETLTALAREINRSGADINIVLRLRPLITVGQNELQARFARRSSEEAREAIETLRARNRDASVCDPSRRKP